MQLSRHASCGPDIAGPDAYLLTPGDRIFDAGFDCDDPDGTLASSLRNVVMAQALAAKAALTEQEL
jgi:hypothetical protein